MSLTVESLAAEALLLSAAERAQLVERLIASLDADPEVEDAWAAKVERRSGSMYINFDERTDVIASLHLCLMCLRNLSDEPALWKWAILSLHSALQGAMVCHLSGSANIGALSDRSATAILEWHERDRRGEIKKIDDGIDDVLGLRKIRFATRQDNPPIEQLADPLTLFKRLYNGNKRYEGGAGNVLEIADSQRASFHRLHKLRNDFAHFTPKGWSIELAGLPSIFLDIVEVIDNISADDWPFRNMEPPEREQLRNLLQDLKKSINEEHQ